MPGIFQPKPMQCDFCSCGDPPVRRYECRDFSADSKAIGVAYRGTTVELNSVGFWMACEGCTQLIEDMNIEGLVDRAMNSFDLKLTQGANKAMREHIAYSFALFFTNRLDK